jgi:hypothetical protein
MLPKELPPNFSSESYASVVDAHGPPPFPVQRPWCDVSHHSLARPGGVRRALGIPNPVAHWYLARDIAAHWKEIKRLVNKSPWSLSRPTLKPKNRRAAGPSVAADEIPKVRARTRAAGRFLVRADVAEFYRSVYTHSIPWAVPGQPAVRAALANHTLGQLWSHGLDKSQQAARNGQTNGLTVGPDTSFILAELIMSAVDVEVAGRCPHVSGLRFYDDFELVASTRAGADAALAALQDTLAHFDLHLNTQKTGVHELPEDRPPSTTWMKDFPRPLMADEQRALIDFFDRVFDQRRAQPETPIVGYACSRIPEHAWSGGAWQLAQDLMSQAVVTDSGAMHQYVRALVRMQVEHGLSPDRARLADTLAAIIGQHAPRAHTSEVAWALWAAMAFDVSLDAGITRSIELVEDDVVGLLALEAGNRGVFARPLDHSIWRA